MPKEGIKTVMSLLFSFTFMPGSGEIRLIIYECNWKQSIAFILKNSGTISFVSLYCQSEPVQVAVLDTKGAGFVSIVLL